MIGYMQLVLMEKYVVSEETSTDKVVVHPHLATCALFRALFIDYVINLPCRFVWELIGGGRHKVHHEYQGQWGAA